MPPDSRRLERYLGTAGSRDTERPASDERLARQLFRRVLSRDPAEGVDQSLLELLNVGESVDDFVTALRASMEWFSRNQCVLGAQSESYRGLNARAITSGMVVVPQIIAECIAAYRLILGREPDGGGFDYFVEVRERDGLVSAVAVIYGSDEAARRLAAAERPSLGVTVLAVDNAAIEILHAVGTDAVLGVVTDIRDSLAELTARLATVGNSVDELKTVAELRFDGRAGRR